jgi:hypothetical protein
MSLNCSCGWNFFLPSTTPGHEVACPSCGQMVRIPGRKPGEAVPTSAGAIAADLQRKQRTIKMLVGLGLAGAVVVGVLVLMSRGSAPPPLPGDGEGTRPGKDASASQGPGTTPRVPAPTNSRPAPATLPPPIYTPEEIQGLRREVLANVWLNNMTCLVSECMRYRNYTNEWAQLQADMTRLDGKIKHDLGELARVADKLPLDPYLQQGDQIIGFVDQELSTLKPAQASQFIQNWLRVWLPGPNQAQVNILRGEEKMTLYVQFPEETKELLSLLRHPALGEPAVPAAAAAAAPVPGSATELAAIPADLIKDIQSRFDALPPGYRNLLGPPDRARLEVLTQSRQGSAEDLEWLRNRILGETMSGFQREADLIRSKVLELEVKVKEPVATDVIYRKNGTKLDCQIIQETEEFVKVKIRNAAATIPRSDIERIEKGRGAATEFTAKNAEAKGKLEKLLSLLAWCSEKQLKLEKEYISYQILLLDAANDKARTTVNLARPASGSGTAPSGSSDPVLSTPQEVLERRIGGIAAEVTGQYKIFADVVNEMRRRTEGYTTRTVPQTPDKSIKGVSVVGNPLTFKPSELTVPQALEIGGWWGSLNINERRDFARYFGLWCAYTRGLSRR